MRLLGLALAGLIATAVPAFAEPQCGPWNKVLDMAFNQRGEKPAFVSILGQGVFIVTIDPKDKSWSIFVQPNEQTICYIASGESWGEATDAVKNRPIGDPA